MFKNYNELIEATLEGGNMPEKEVAKRYGSITVESAAPSMYQSWLVKVHDAISDAYPNLSQWETTPAEKATTQALRKVLVVIKRTLGR